METKVSDLEKLEELITEYRKEKDMKRKHIAYLNLIEESLKLVKKIVIGIYPIPGTITKDDLIQVGAVGLLKAIETYEVETKGSFKTYASRVVKGKILHYLRDKSNIIKPPREAIENITKVKEAVEYLTIEEDKIPTAEEISKYLHFPKEKIEEIINFNKAQNTVSLDQKIYSNEGTETLLDQIQPENNTTFEETYENKKIIEYALDKLPEIDKKAICMYYIDGESRKEIAKRLNISATQVSRILKRALNKLYNIIQEELIEDED